MAVPTNPLAQQVIERVVAVLEAISAGSSYFYTPIAVKKKFVHYREARLTATQPLYMVFRDSGGVIQDIGAGANVLEEEWFLNVKGYVHDPVDTVTKLVRAIRDIRHAIDTDARSEASGSLGNLGNVTIEEAPETDNGYLSLEGFGFFDQRIRVRSDGNFGEL